MLIYRCGCTNIYVRVSAGLYIYIYVYTYVDVYTCLICTLRDLLGQENEDDIPECEDEEDEEDEDEKPKKTLCDVFIETEILSLP